MNLKYCEYFIEIAKTRNLSSAADHLYITHSALSQFLGREEEELGVKLFKRKHNTLELTFAGQKYLEACKDIVNRRNMLYQDISDISSCKIGRMNVGITPHWGGHMLAGLYPVFKKRYPNLVMNFVEENTFPLMKLLGDKELDIAVLALNHTELMNPLSYEIVFRHPMVVAAPASLCGDISSGPEGIGIREFARFGFILSRYGTIIREIQDEIFADASLSPQIICEINSVPALISMVRSGMGVAILAECDLQPDPEIRYFRLDKPWEWKIGAVYRSGFKKNEATAFFIDSIRDYFEELQKKTRCLTEQAL